MADGRVSNPQGAYGIDNVDNASRVTAEVKTASALTKGDVVCWVTQATNVTPSVRISTQGTDDPASVAGVALEAAAANSTVLICRSGPCLVNIGTGTVAAWERAILLSGTPGAADGDAHDASDIVGDSFGVFLGAEVGTTNQAVLDVQLG